MLLAWLLAWWHLAPEWLADEQYRYGFGVPFLAAWMAWRRFHGPLKPAPASPPWWCLTACALLMLALGETLARHDPLWRFTGATLECGATLLSLAWLRRLGGAPLVRRQIFPLLFAATAVPWPVPVELWTIEHLASGVTDVATFTANLLGVAALQHGNTIELARGVVGVDDACSGIQSLQATLMASLFLGEFFALGTARRLALAVTGAAVSFIMNCGRVLALTLLAHSRGSEAALEWHDLVGGSATVCALALVLGAAALLARGNSPSPISSSAPSTLPGALRGALARMPEGVAIFSIVLAIPFGVRAWYSHLEKSRAGADPAFAWQLSDRALPPGWTAASVAPTKPARTALRFDEWQSFEVRNPAGGGAHIIRLAWKAGTRLPSFVTNHTPAVCMPSAGWAQSAPPFLLPLKIHGRDLPCAAYPFARDGARVLALQSLSSGGRAELRLIDPAQIPGTLRRLATLWEAPLRQITDELLLYLPDPGDAAARKNSATAFFEAVLTPGGGH